MNTSETGIPALQTTHDLTYRPSPGTNSFYCLDIVYHTLGSGGQVQSLENYRGGFRRQVDRVDAAGAWETITWKHVARRGRGAKADYGPWQNLDWAHDFEYSFNAEQGYDEFHWHYDSFPRDETSWPLGWNVLLLTVDAHFEFDFLRSRQHGAIDRLTEIGDSLVVPDSDHPFCLRFPPVVDVPAFTKRNLCSTFLGLSRVNDTDCAVVAFRMDVSPFQMSIAGATLDVSSMFRGTLQIRLADGALEQGEFDEVVVGDQGPVYPRYRIRRIDETVWKGGTMTQPFD